MRRLAAHIVAAATALLIGATAAQAQAIWTANQYTDENGTRIGVLGYGVPETDDSTLYVICTANRPDVAELNLFIDPGPNPVGREVTVTFTTSRLAPTTRTATIVDSGLVGPYPQVLLWTTDPLWDNFAHDTSMSFAVQGRPYATVSLAGSSGPVAQWLQICNSFAGGPGNAAAPVNTPAAGSPLIGPLYVVGQAPARAFANANGTGEMTPFAPGTELMSLNSTSVALGMELVQVAAFRGQGITAWVPRGQLVPTTGGASEYQNLNQVANLVIRAQPSANGAVLGSIPPGARGIYDQGQISGGWVRVSYNGITGWASHDYLLPILPFETGPAIGPITPGPITPGPVVGGKGGGDNTGVAGNGNPAVDGFYIGTWQQIVSKGACSDNCVLSISRNGPALTVFSSSGWQADVYWGADGDVYYATGTGAWTTGPFAGGAVYVDLIASPDGATLLAYISVFDGPPQAFNFIRQ